MQGVLRTSCSGACGSPVAGMPASRPKRHYLSKTRNDWECLDLRPAPNSQFRASDWRRPLVGYPAVKGTAPVGGTGAVVSTGVLDVPRLRGPGTGTAKPKSEIRDSVPRDTVPGYSPDFGRPFRIRLQMIDRCQRRLFYFSSRDSYRQRLTNCWICISADCVAAEHQQAAR